MKRLMEDLYTVSAARDAKARVSRLALSIALTLLSALTLSIGAGQVEATLDDTSFIHMIYSDLLDRPTDEAGQAAWVNAIQSGAVTRLSTARGVLGSTEYENRVVQALYQRFLGRSADQSGLGYVDVLQHGVIREQVMATILGSGEYFANRGGGTDLGFLKGLYQDVLHRDIDSAGQAQFSALLASGVSRASIALMMLQSREARELLIGNLYQQLLLRTMEAGGRDAWIAFLASGGSVEDIIAGILASEEYANLDRTGHPAGSILLDPFGTGFQTSSSVFPLDAATLFDPNGGPGSAGQDPGGTDGQGGSSAVPQPRPLWLIAAGLALLLAYAYLGIGRLRGTAAQRLG
jgi:Domain of unknown function (DUF4214)